jgi:NAD(P)-dependent dehydrogenase (short-subunit alcohol dehydrogenase family)
MKSLVVLGATAAAAIAVFLAREGYEMRTALATVRAANAGASFTGRRALVCGGTSGIGEGIAERLARAQFTVSIVGRNAERGRAVVEKLNALGGSGHSFIPCDSSLLAGIQACASSYTAAHPVLDVLVMSQGMASIQGRTPTSEDIDEKLALHYYGRMAWLVALLPSLRRSPSPRVLSVLSAGVHPPYTHWAEDPELRTHYTVLNAANAACFYNDLALDALSRAPENAGVTFVHAAPGFVNTRWGTEMPWYIRMLVRAIQPLGRSPQDCAEFMCAPLLRAADAGAGAGAGPAAEGGAGAGSTTPGTLLLIGQYAQPVSRSSGHTAEARAAVWRHTLAVLSRTGALGGTPASAADGPEAAPAAR